MFRSRNLAAKFAAPTPVLRRLCPLLPLVLFLLITRSLTAQMVLTIKQSPELSDMISLRAWEQGPGKSSIPTLLSTGMLVRNVSGLSIVAVMVKAVVLRRDERVETRWLLRHNFDSDTMLMPGKQYTVSPFGIPIAHILEVGFVDAKLQQAVDESTTEARLWKEVSIEIDSVLDSAGRLRGKDSADSFRLFSEWLRADRDVADRLLQVRERLGGAEEIAQALKPIAIGNSTSFQNRDHYSRRWTLSARSLLRRLEVGGPQAVFSEASRLRDASRSRVIFR